MRQQHSVKLSRTLRGKFMWGVLLLAASVPAWLRAQAPLQNQPYTVHVCQVLKAQLQSAAVGHADAKVDTAHIQHALSLCDPGKALVLESSGGNDAFLSAPLIIPRGVVLFLSKGVTLYASRNPRDYDLQPMSCGVAHSAHPGCKPFLFAYQAAYSGVMGDGTIDGQGGVAPSAQGKSWWQLRAAVMARNAAIAVPDLVSSYESQFFAVRGVHLRNAAGAHLSLYKTIGFQGSNFTIDAPHSATGASGVLLSNSPGATLSNLNIQVLGSALDLRASILGGTSHVKIDGLHIVGGTGISLGDDVYGDTSAIQMSHVSIEGTAKGFDFDLRGTKGGHVHNVQVQDACLRKVTQPLVVEAGAGAVGNALPAETQAAFEHVTVAGSGMLTPQGVQADSSAACPATGNVAQTTTAAAWRMDWSTVERPGTHTRLVVAGDGSGDFRTIEQAVEALPDTGGEIDVKPGTYREVVTIRKPHVQLHGLESDPARTVLVFDNTGPRNGGTFNSATVFVEADNVSIDHMTIANDAGNKGQAVALAVTADRADFRNLRLLGAQDTLFAAARYCYGDYGPCVPTRQYFKDSYIDGNTDFIFGDSMAVFDHCELHGIHGKGVMYTAQGKHYAEQQSGYVFDHCRLTADPAAGRITLGRPWRPYSTVVYLHCVIDAPVMPAGWTEWPRFGKLSLPVAYYAEYESTGPGASPATREPFSHQLSTSQAAQWSLHRFLAGNDEWNPAGDK